MSARKISLLQAVLVILALRFRSSSQRQTQSCCQQVAQNRDAIAKSLSLNPSQLLLPMPSYDAA